MEPWYKVVTPREEVRAGRSFNPDEFAIHLEQVVAGRAPADYRDPAQFFSRNVFTRALTDLVATVLRRLAGHTANAPPVLTLVTQFGGGKTHTLTALYHPSSAPRRPGPVVRRRAARARRRRPGRGAGGPRGGVRGQRLGSSARGRDALARPGAPAGR